MAFPVNVGNLLQLRINTTVVGQRCLNVLHYIITTEGSSTDGDTVLDDLLSAASAAGQIVDAVTEFMAPNCTIDYADLQVIFPDRFRSVRRTYNAPGGGLDGTCTTANVAVVITKRVDQAFKNAGGSLHLAGVGEEGYANGLLIGDTLTQGAAVRDAIDNTLTGPVTGTVITPVIARIVTPVATTRIITSALLQPEVRIMRRRTVGVGQ